MGRFQDGLIDDLSVARGAASGARARAGGPHARRPPSSSLLSGGDQRCGDHRQIEGIFFFLLPYMYSDR